MKKEPPITHLVIDTSSSNEYDNGDCDYPHSDLLPIDSDADSARNSPRL